MERFLFWQNFEILREEIKTDLFGSSPSPFKEEFHADDQIISATLVRIMKKWRSKLKEKSSQSLEETIVRPVVQAEPTEPEMPETVILSPNEAAETKILSTQPAEEEETLILPLKSSRAGNRVDIDFQDEEIIQETVILSSGEGENKSLNPERTNFDTSESDLLETVIQSPSENHQGHFKVDKKPDTANSSFEDLNASSIDKDHFKEKKTVKDNKKDTPEQDDDLAETVILQPNIEKKDKGSTHE